ncbi:hypothetical protein [Pandoraea anhela]|uniref:hypothetical protein n=1 Tax=Pandoraea anhela TaxID=2508295 RepID=UPI00123F508C|nr:hypothetical protein [Pandoraea anhela]
MIESLERTIASPGGAGAADFEAFLAAVADIADIADVPGAAPYWVQHRDAHDLRALRHALAYCQLTSYPEARRYLVDTIRHYPVATGECSLRVLQSLTPELRAEMLFLSASPWCPLDDAVKIFNDGLITLKIPRTSWRVPILPVCVNQARGGITANEMFQLLSTRSTHGMTIGQAISRGRYGLLREDGQALADWHLKLGHAYAAAQLSPLAAMEYVTACEAALSVDSLLSAVRGIDGALSAINDCTSVGVVREQGARLLGMLDLRGLRLISAEAALLLANKLASLACPALGEALRANARRGFEPLGLPTRTGLSVDELAPAIRRTIARHRGALAAGGLHFSTYRIRFDGLRDPYAGVDFREGAAQAWVLLASRHPASGDAGVFDIVTSATGARAAQTALHPQTMRSLVNGDLFQGILVLDLLQAAGGDVPALNWRAILKPALPAPTMFAPLALPAAGPSTSGEMPCVAAGMATRPAFELRRRIRHMRH